VPVLVQWLVLLQQKLRLDSGWESRRLWRWWALHVLAIVGLTLSLSKRLGPECTVGLVWLPLLLGCAAVLETGRRVEAFVLWELRVGLRQSVVAVVGC